MATYNNITVIPNSGTGNSSLSISATENTGRNSRQVLVTGAGTGAYSGILSDNSLVVTQSGKASYLSVTPDKDVTAFSSEGGTLTYTGDSNLSNIVLGTGSLDTLLTSATINEIPVSKSDLQNGYTVAGDPGATAAYGVTLVYTIPANSSGDTYTGSIGGQSMTVVQASATPVGSLSFSNSTTTLNAAGDTASPSISVQATAGLQWSITVTENT